MGDSSARTGQGQGTPGSGTAVGQAVLVSRETELWCVSSAPMRHFLLTPALCHKEPVKWAGSEYPKTTTEGQPEGDSPHENLARVWELETRLMKSLSDNDLILS